MCNGFSSRISQGGATAFLRPLSTYDNEPKSNDTIFDYQVTLHEDPTARADGIHLSISKPLDDQAEPTQIQPSPVEAFRSYWVEIHPDGDLTPSKSRDALPPLHRFPLQNLTSPQNLEFSPTAALASINLIPGQTKSNAKRLRLDACETGVIGRRMSVVDATGMRVAEGVIGWN
ncbi:hypothetical protein AJ79_01013 [Helicocarpus griseus UAMH5409]|uniref:Uncharacterized protein n=1 Tax=Helicocarpus griseus UAMH5409 TaxID=1447875 RepID=A0A2B7Y9B2_9EURO|nr:hypothetical protein AJ79_01013 [Helicocarpus griseus UAMH5409]